MVRLLPAVSVIPIWCESLQKVFQKKKRTENSKMMKRYVVAFAGWKSCIGNNQGHRQGMFGIITLNVASNTGAAVVVQARCSTMIVLIAI